MVVHVLLGLTHDPALDLVDVDVLHLLPLLSRILSLGLLKLLSLLHRNDFLLLAFSEDLTLFILAFERVVFLVLLEYLLLEIHDLLRALLFQFCHRCLVILHFLQHLHLGVLEVLQF